MPPKQMSLEAALQEEANDIMALLEGRKQPISPTSPHRQQLGNGLRSHSPAKSRSPGGKPRSMLDIAPGVQRDQAKAARHSSIAVDGRNSAVGSPTQSNFESGGGRPGRSMLDLGPTPTTTNRGHRQSHGSTSPGLPTIHQGFPSPKDGSGRGVEEKYQFDMLPSIDSQAAPKRNTQGDGGFFGAGATSNTAKRRPNSMSAVFGSGTLGPDGRPKGTKSSSPAPRSGRSQSPANKSLNSNKLKSTPGTYVSSDGKVINLDQAYRRLSDAALLKSGGRLADLPTSKNVNADRGEELAPDGGVRVTKDYYEDDEDNDGSSEEEEDENYNSDDSDASQAFGSRGRARARADSELSDTPREAKSLLAAAEQERKDVSTSQSKKAMKSMLDISPAVHSKAGLSADQLFFKKEKPVIHPRTSYDHGNSSGMGLRSGMSTPDIVDSDEERTKNDFDTAQKMAITLSPIHSSPEAHRCIRQVLRGDFRKYQLEAEQGLRRQRMYLVATDLSEEAAYALEWTIGTVLRDGDTLLAVYAVDEEAGTGEDVSTTVTANNSVAIGEGSKQMNEAAAIVRTLSNEQGLVVPGERSAYRKSTDVGGSRRSSSHVRTRSKSKGVYKDKAESERYHATQEISDRCIKLLRKTKLQVRVVVEVFHCKSPKHMITEVIDYLEPTLVILGSRGRSALKGVLLGSFSNYLVTKSSVPVMVARKKLRKHSKKGPGTRLSNMLATPGSRLESAVIDRPSMGTRRGSVGT